MGFQIVGPDAGVTHFGDEPIDWDAADAARRTEAARCGRGRVAFH